MAKRPKRRAINHGESYLAGLQRVKVELVNGEVIEFDWEAEFAIPLGLEEKYRAAEIAPARLAFWSAQHERAESQYRVARNELQTVVGALDDAYRLEHDQKNYHYTERSIRSLIRCSEEYIKRRKGLDELKTQAATLRAIRSALERRCWMLQTLISKPIPPQ